MSHKIFPDVPTGYPFPELEQRVLDFWSRERIFEKSLEQTRGGREFVFYEGPPTANNRPHVGHVLTRVIKDLYPRFRTQRGYHVARKAGWDTHGLPVEIEVEKRLGFSGKEQIEEYGIVPFNRACLDSVHTYEKEWRKMSERFGYWVDLDDAYLTYTNQYIESVWWALKELADKGLLSEGYKIQPYCARCGTTLSSHEVAQNYKEADDPSVWALFPARPGQELPTADGASYTVPEGLSLVAWTTTPWTLLAHVALAVQKGMTYRVVENPDPDAPASARYLLFGEGLNRAVPLEATVPGEDGSPTRKRFDLRELPAVARFRGEDLLDLLYDRPFRLPFDEVPADAPHASEAEWDAHGFRVVSGSYVTADEGTGIVHTAPLYGEDDYRTGRRYGLPLVRSVDPTGTVADRDETRGTDGRPGFAGEWFKDADPKILRELKARGRLLHSERYLHNYPFCWRCDQPLLYFGTSSWFVRTTERRDELVEKNREIQWLPAHVGEGRFGNWLENVVDWALSRSRYWGTPLPVWRCDGCPRVDVVGSYAELFDKAGKAPPADFYDREQFDPHRPFVDRGWGDAPFEWDCPDCGGRMGRVDDVIDAWFDSGSMPYAQHHYPFENREIFEKEQFPADFIAEAVDQTRGWFYTLHALGTLLFDSPAYKTCLVMGHVNDESGRKMSKRLGNVVDPMEMVDETGADALRWYFYVNNPLASSRFSTRLVRESAQSFLLPLWNALSFFTIYANLDGWRPGAEAPKFAHRPALDRFILLRLDRLTRETTEHLDAYRTMEAARGIEAFIDELTNWYIRRSRDRFWSPTSGDEVDVPDEAGKESAYQALYEVLVTLSRLLAPFTPFLAEVLHEHLVLPVADQPPRSVHLAGWPEAGSKRSEPELEEAMGWLQRIVRLGHAARNAHAIKTRQPLPAVTLVAADESLAERIGPYEDVLRDELNVHEIRWAADRAEYVHHEVKPVYPKCGPRFGKRMKEVAAALAAGDGDVLAAELEDRGELEVYLEGGPETLSAEEVEVRLVEREGTATQGDRELLVALDTRLTPELIAEGWAREVVNRLATTRKEMDLDYSQRIRVTYAADDELAAALATHGEWIAEQTLATELTRTDELTGEAKSAPVEDMDFRFTLEKIEA